MTEGANSLDEADKMGRLEHRFSSTKFRKRTLNF